MKRILVPTDFSEHAEYALKVAAQIAKQNDSEIYLLHMLELPFQEVDVAGGYGEPPEALFYRKLAEKQFNAFLDKPYLSQITIHEKVKADISFSEIKDACRENNIDIIIMGSHGASGIKEMFIGSNAEKVVRNSEVPVLVIKNDHDDFAINDFVFASDFKNDNKETYRQATDFAKAFGANVHLLMVNTPNNFTTTAKANTRIDDFIKDVDFENYTITVYNDDSVEKGILNFSQHINADIIGISTHGRQGIAHFFNGSISEDLVNHANRPVITFKIWE
ncbi:universal stress protein [Ichthyenterobacterium sp. W332]|uniref:Universal stress protein n=1 Tax=Microcosmobacter mediterraneus TaxID=3075607 RepID=A0ABU2YKI5_9FLAO|nr:universal stress protein [Ichthyenterobacterium sp. W332]MDT0557740.1 universal stress protein [Ichthyenterobacterium sp. W332]